MSPAHFNIHVRDHLYIMDKQRFTIESATCTAIWETYRVTEPLGLDTRITEVIAQRIREASDTPWREQI